MQRPNTGGRYIRDPKTKKLTRADDVKPAKVSEPAAEELSTADAAQTETNGGKPDTKGK